MFRTTTVNIVAEGTRLRHNRLIHFINATAKQNGFSLIEVLFVVAIMSVTALVFASQMQWFVKGINGSGFIADSNALNQEVRALLSSPIACQNTFGTILTGAPPSSTASFPTATLVNSAGTPTYSVPNVYENGSVQLTGMVVDSYAPSSNPLSGQMTLGLMALCTTAVGPQGILKSSRLSSSCSD